MKASSEYKCVMLLAASISVVYNNTVAINVRQLPDI